MRDDGRSVLRRPSPELLLRARERAAKARKQLFVLVPLLAGVLIAYSYRVELFGVDRPMRIATAFALILIGLGMARGVGRMVEPRLARLEPSSAGLVGFLMRLALLGLTVIVALRLAGLELGTLALGASFTAVIVGLAAQQTVGNVLAGLVLLTARPFQIGDRVRFAGFGMDVEGTVRSFGLLYVTMHDGDDIVLVPNNTALTMSARPLREPDGVDVRATLPVGFDPQGLEERIEQGIDVPTRKDPVVAMEEITGNEVVMRIQATPQTPDDGPRLAGQVLRVVAALSEPRGAVPS